MDLNKSNNGHKSVKDTKIIEKNKYAYFQYFIEDCFEAGIVLEGNEVKSIRGGNVSLKDSFCEISGGELWLKNAHIAPYEKGTFLNPDSRRNRKLLMKKSEIEKLTAKVKIKGYTLVPTKIYFSNRLVKIEIGLAKGKHLFDKKEVKKEKDLKRDADREIKRTIDKYNK